MNTSSLLYVINSLPEDEHSQSQSQLICTQSLSGTQFTSEDDLIYNNVVLPLSQVIQLDQVTVLDFYTYSQSRFST